jgi:hypothetical protein
VEPELIGTFTATGDDEAHYTVRVWMTFHTVPGNMHDRGERWIPDAHATLVTDDGDEVCGVSGNEARFGIAGSRVILTPDESLVLALRKGSSAPALDLLSLPRSPV